MGLFHAALNLLRSLEGTGERDAEAAAQDFATAAESHLKELVDGLTQRVTALEHLNGAHVATGLGSLGGRIRALEESAGITAADPVLASAITALTPPAASPCAAPAADAAEPAAPAQAGPAAASSTAA